MRLHHFVCFLLKKSVKRHFCSKFFFFFFLCLLGSNRNTPHSTKMHYDNLYLSPGYILSTIYWEPEMSSSYCYISAGSHSNWQVATILLWQYLTFKTQSLPLIFKEQLQETVMVPNGISTTPWLEHSLRKYESWAPGLSVWRTLIHFSHFPGKCPTHKTAVTLARRYCTAFSLHWIWTFMQELFAKFVSTKKT